MRFDGYTFRTARNIVLLPKSMWQKRNFCEFGKVVPESEPHPETVPGAFLTDYHWREYEGENGVTIATRPVYAIPVPLRGFSLTNMAYGTDGRLYLCIDRICYTAVSRREQERREMKRLERRDRRIDRFVETSMTLEKVQLTS